MSLINRLTASLALTGVLLITALASSNASAVSIAGLRPSGLPAFSNDVTVRIHNGKVTIKTNGESKIFKLIDSGGTTFGSKGSFSLTTNFNSSNVWDGVGDTLTIKGVIGSVTTKQTLVTADLSAFAWDPLQPNILGWNTTNIECNAGLNLACTLSESLYVTMNSDFCYDDGTGTDVCGDFANAKNWTASGKALTTVPVPAAVWLFGSGLAFLGATARRRRVRR